MAMFVAELPIQIDREKIAEFCRARGIRKLSLFGSVLRDDFGPARSDVDVMAEPLPTAHPGWEFYGCHEDLAPSSDASGFAHAQQLEQIFSR